MAWMAFPPNGYPASAVQLSGAVVPQRPLTCLVPGCRLACRTGSSGVIALSETPDNPRRRAILAGIGALAALPVLPAAAAPVTAASPAAAGLTGALTFHVVDGWVLSSADLRALGLHAR